MSLCEIHTLSIKKYKVIKSLPESVTVMETPLCTCKKGSFTVEAAVILPLLACFFSFLLFYFQIMQVQLSVQNALEKTGRNLALLSAIEMEKETESSIDVTYLTLAKASLYMDLKADENVMRYVSGGALGVTLLASEMDGDDITLVANYGIKFPVNLLGKKLFFVNQKASFRKWTGWHVTNIDDMDEIIVYITKNGEVYHKRKSCPYLTLSIRKVKIKQIQKLRNKSGGKYSECEACEEEGSNWLEVYITDYGERYHYVVNCSGLKRTIYQKKLVEVREKDACSKCWK